MAKRKKEYVFVDTNVIFFGDSNFPEDQNQKEEVGKPSFKQFIEEYLEESNIQLMIPEVVKGELKLKYDDYARGKLTGLNERLEHLNIAVNKNYKHPNEELDRVELHETKTDRNLSAFGKEQQAEGLKAELQARFLFAIRDFFVGAFESLGVLGSAAQDFIDGEFEKFQGLSREERIEPAFVKRHVNHGPILLDICLVRLGHEVYDKITCKFL